MTVEAALSHLGDEDDMIVAAYSGAFGHLFRKHVDKVTQTLGQHSGPCGHLVGTVNSKLLCVCFQ